MTVDKNETRSGCTRVSRTIRGTAWRHAVETNPLTDPARDEMRSYTFTNDSRRTSNFEYTYVCIVLPKAKRYSDKRKNRELDIDVDRMYLYKMQWPLEIQNLLQNSHMWNTVLIHRYYSVWFRSPETNHVWSVWTMCTIANQCWEWTYIYVCIYGYQPWVITWLYMSILING